MLGSSWRQFLLAALIISLAATGGNAAGPSNHTARTFHDHPNSVYYDGNNPEEVRPIADRKVNALIDTPEETLGSSTATAARNNLQPARRNLDWLAQQEASNSSWQQQVDYRLPTGVNPLSYDVRLLSDLESGQFQFSGSVNIVLNVSAPTQLITLHADDLVINHASVVLQPLEGGTALQIASYNEDSVRHFYTIQLSSHLEVGTYSLSIPFQGHHRDDTSGFYRSYYYKNDTVRWIATTQFQPTSARRAFPCFDEPGYKAKFKITIGRTADRHTLSNMPLAYTETEGDIFWDHFEETPMPISTYLVAFVVSDYTSLNSSDGFYKTWQRDDATSQAQYSIDVSPKIMSALENYTGLDYFLPKMDQVAVPDFWAGAMENWGLVTYRERVILLEEGGTPSSDRQLIATIIAHEFAHQWFGNLVSPIWWDHTWLNEGFARFFEYFATAQVETTWRLEDQFVPLQVHTSLAADSLETALPLITHVDTPASVMTMFGVITYNKGGSVLRMMEHFLTEETFRKGLSRYLLLHANSTAVPDDLYSALQHQYDEDFANEELAGQAITHRNLPASVKTIMDTWTLKNGYPVISVTRNYSDGTAEVSQSRFLLRRDPSSTDTATYSWWVPLTYTTQANPDFTSTTADYWLTALQVSSETINLAANQNQWALFNIQQTGFYRVNYDARNWQLLSDYLNSEYYDEIHVLNRAQLLDDAFNLARAGTIDYSTPLKLSKYLSRESDYIPWLSALTAFNFINRRIMGLGEYEHHVFKSYMLKLLDNVYNSLGLEGKPDDTHVTRLHRNLILSWACNYGLKSCTDMARSEFAKLIADPDNYSVDPDLKTVVYCNGLRYGGEEEFEFLWNRYLNYSVNTEQVLILGTIGCTRNETLAHRHLRRSITEDSNIRSQDITTIYPSVHNNPYGVNFAINFLRDNYKEILEFNNNSTSALSTVVSSIAGAIYSQEQLDTLRGVIITNITTDIGPNTLLNNLQSAELNLQWLQTHGSTVSRWVKQQDYRLPTNIVPEYYFVVLEPNLDDGTFQFDGRVNITFSVANNTDRIVLHANDLEIEEDTIEVGVGVSAVTVDDVRQFYDIKLEQELVAGWRYQLHMLYKGYHRDDMEGFYRSYYYKNGTKRWLATTQFQTTGARRAFPCFDEPGLKARFKLTIGRTDDRHALANMPLETSIKDEYENVTWDVFQETPMPISTYLIAFVVSDFDNLSSSDGFYGTWQRADALRQAQYSIDVSPLIMSSMENFTELDYFLPKMDQVAVPDFSAGAMENWGLVAYREDLILVEEGVSTSWDRQNVATVIAHEFAHMWFGNLVSPAWWSYTWISEGFARYFEFFAAHWVQTTWRLDDQFVVRQVQSALLADSSESAHALTVDVGSPESIESIFNAITYNKGGAVIRMMEYFMTTATFRRGLQLFLTRYGNSTAEPSGLFSSLDEELLQDFPDRTVSVAEVMNTWTVQSGYPLITVIRDYITGAITVTQERFLLQRSTSASDRKWWVPLTYTSLSELNFSNTTTRLWLNVSSSSVNISDLSASSSDWVIFNIQEIGFYRVNYDSRNWEHISRYLDSNRHVNIHVLNRAQLLDDAFNLARAGVIGYPVALQLSRYLSREEDYIPWLSALTAFNFLDRRLQGLSQYDYEVFQNYILRLLEKAYQTVGLQENPTDSHHIKLHRNQILTWACRFGHEECLTMVTSHLTNLTADPDNYLVPPDLKSVVYCNALRHGGEAEFDFFFQRYRAHNVNSEQMLILSVMGCTNNETLAHRFLRLLITNDSGIRSQDEIMISRSVLNNHYGVDFAINYLTNNFQDIIQFRNSTNDVRSLISSIAGAIFTQEQLDKLRLFVETHEDLLGITTSTALSSAEANLQWLSTHGPTIISWLQQQDYRLPTSLRPDTYVIKLVPDLTAFTFTGEVTIRLTAVEVTDRIVLHANDLTVDKAGISVVSVSSGSTLAVNEVLEDSLRHLLVIILDQNLESGQQYELSISYSGHMRDDMFGFYRSYYYRDGQRRWIGTTQLHPTHARRAFPCFDEPALKARFNMSISVPAGYHALFNTKKISSDSEVSVDGRRWESFEQTPVMSTYLVAFVVSDFVQRSNEAGNVSVWQRAEAVQQAQYAEEITQPIVSAMEELVGHKYQLSKLDHVAIPDLTAGAMENWGLVTYREALILWDENVSTTADKMNIATTIGHEVAHKWFGNLVTHAWWMYTWLNEGFATYFETFATAQVETDWRLEELFVVLFHQPALASDARETSRPMVHGVNSPSEILSVFDFINYAKAGSVIRMMEHFLTRDVFLEGLHNYLETHAYNTVEPDDLYAAMQSASSLTDVSVKVVMDTWATQMGYPLVTVTRNFSAGTVRVEQERFLLSRSLSPSDDHDYKWWIPLSYTNKTSANFNNTAPTSWLPANLTQISFNDISSTDDWLIFNLQETGYYRVNYDLANWQLIIQQLLSEHDLIPAVSRAQILDDSLNLARAGILEYDVALNLSSYLTNETDYIPWYSALSAFTFLNARLRGAASQDYQLFTNYVVRLTEGVYNSLGFTEAETDQHTTKLLRALILNWACDLGIESCVTWAKEELARQITNTTYRILPDVSRVAYCTALRHGGENEWNHLWQRYLASNVGTEQVLLLGALGCAADEVTINRYLNLSISEDSGIRSQDAASVFAAVYNNRIGVDIAFNFLINNYRDISEFYGGVNAIGSILIGIAGQLSTREQVDALRRFVEDNEGNLGTALGSSRLAIESAEENLAWLALHGDDIFDWLRQRNEDNQTSSTPPGLNTTTPPGLAPTTTPPGGTASVATLSVVLALIPLVASLLHLKSGL